MSEMEEPEDSELHDLVKEVLEKSGSMAKIRVIIWLFLYTIIIFSPNTILHFSPICRPSYAPVFSQLWRRTAVSRYKHPQQKQCFLALRKCVYPFFLFQNTKSPNDDLQSLSKSADGVLLICLIREFLEYFGLSFTASVFDPELASYGVHCACKDSSKLRSQLNVSQDLSNGQYLLFVGCALSVNEYSL